jgi:SAM-dependent methyltransferase
MADRIHESSPVERGASERLRTASRYVSSQYFEGVQSGDTVRGVRCENLERMSFGDSSLDLHVTQDVMEHVFEPDAVWREIARTLAPGGMHIFTTPLIEKDQPSKRAASLVDGAVVHHRKPSYQVTRSPRLSPFLPQRRE